MTIVALHTDFRIYWPARLRALGKALQKRGDVLHVIEIAGKGSPYAFAEASDSDDMPLHWQILFPDASPEMLSGKEIEPVLFKALDEINPDVIIAGAIAFPSGALAVRWGQIHNTKVVVFDDSKIDAVKRNPLVNFIKKSVYAGVDAMFYPAADWIPTGKFWGFSENCMFFGVDVVDNDFWSNAPTAPNDFGDYFLAVGRQIPKKNFKGIISAYADYVKQIGREKAINLIIIGEGPDHSDIEKCVTDNHLEDKVRLLPFLQQQDLPPYYLNALLLLLLSSEQETWGLVINEAMACGCAIIASRQCGASNILVKEGVNGYRVDWDDTKAMTDAMIRFTSLSPEQRSAMGAASREIIAGWGLPRFVAGATAAIDHVTTAPKARPNPLARLIISRWKGQYHPI